MRFWCSRTLTPWTWEFQAYPGVWAAVLALAVPYLIAQHRRRGPNPDRARRTALWMAGVVAFWLATDWPLGLLGAGYLASAHMVQYMLYSLVAAPLLLLGTPEWMARRTLERLRLYRVTSQLARPLAAGVLFNLVLVTTHSPWAVDTLRTNQATSFGMDVVWLLAGMVLWLPVVAPLPELIHPNRGVKMAYLFLAAGIVPAVPGGFLTFAGFPLYSIYELAPRVHGLSADTDQQMAGLIMKIGGIPVIWGVILAQMLKWADESGVGRPPVRAVRDARPGRPSGLTGTGTSRPTSGPARGSTRPG